MKGGYTGDLPTTAEAGVVHVYQSFRALAQSGRARAAMVLLAILLGTMVAGIGSVWLAALLSFGALARYTQHMLSLAAGALLGTAFLHLLPEAFESQIAPDAYLPRSWSAWFFSFCSTRRSCGTTAMNTMTKHPATRMRPMTTLSRTVTTTATTTNNLRAARLAAGPSWRATVSMPSATAS